MVLPLSNPANADGPRPSRDKSSRGVPANTGGSNANADADAGEYDLACSRSNAGWLQRASHQCHYQNHDKPEPTHASTISNPVPYAITSATNPILSFGMPTIRPVAQNQHNAVAPPPRADCRQQNIVGETLLFFAD